MPELDAGTVVQNPYEWGIQSAHLIADYLNGDKSKIPADGVMIIPPFYSVPTDDERQPPGVAIIGDDHIEGPVGVEVDPRQGLGRLVHAFGAGDGQEDLQLAERVAHGIQ